MKNRMILSLAAFTFAIVGAFASFANKSETVISAWYKAGTSPNETCESAGNRNCITNGTFVCQVEIDGVTETLYETNACTTTLERP